ncbi:hypothetical protein ASAC_0694 [Acidilobus saccharovorans 345-15]|uniref:Uncharacterized protein n=1 Tax=Acidilobus saccharovorans (strain DSM 16705 / JCM 18335 / VKM B-2471 / 345-15) TaxID=666510 RepID=D9Q1B2_ACIS3|nr:hypothetical protein [Acidilobus saccharovorans]ADL19100.1 hypothetical protein ASAC_0694 [Acidilobus saccharovorans 345-15]
MRRAAPLLLAFAVLAALAVAEADLIIVYRAAVSLEPVASPVVYKASAPACGFAPNLSVLYYGAVQGSSGYAFTLLVPAQRGYEYKLQWPISVFTAAENGTATISLGGGSTTISVRRGDTYLLYLLSGAPLSSVSLSGSLAFSPSSALGLSFVYGLRTAVHQPPQGAALSFVDGQSLQTTMYYQGDYDGTPSGGWPYDLGPSAAEAYYWDLWYAGSAAQPVMDMTGYLQEYYGNLQYAPSAGAVLWSYSYAGGHNLTIAAVVTYSSPSLALGHGVYFYLFLAPQGKAANQSIPYVSSESLSQPPSPVMGDVMYPASNGSYLVVQFDPAWYYNLSLATGPGIGGSSGPWNAWVVSVTVAGKGKKAGLTANFEPSPSPNLGPPWSGWDGVGSWSPTPWVPGPGDYVLVCVTYDPSNGYIYGRAVDLNYPFYNSTFSEYVGSYFSPPAAGAYYVGVGSGTGYLYAADWGLVWAWAGP